MKNILKYPQITNMFRNESLESLYKEKKEIESKGGRGLNGIRKMLVLNCLEEVIKEKELAPESLFNCRSSKFRYN